MIDVWVGTPSYGAPSVCFKCLRDTTTSGSELIAADSLRADICYGPVAVMICCSAHDLPVLCARQLGEGVWERWNAVSYDQSSSSA